MLYEVLIGLTGYLFDDVTENPVTAITVAKPLARLEIQRCVFEAFNELTGSDRSFGITAITGHDDHAGGMGQQVVDGDVFPGRRAVLDVSADGILDVQPALRLQDKDRHGGELLGDGTQAEPGLGRIGNFLLTIRQSVPTVEQHLTFFGDQHGAGECSILADLAEPRINPCNHVWIKDHFGGHRC